MKIQQLFNALEEKSLKENIKEIFAESGLVNDYAKLDYGFFPLGSGILSEKSKIEEAEINEGGIMVLGNDFGTASYIKDKCKDKREKKTNSTLRNILNVGLDLNRFFFTNFYLGLRTGEQATMTKREIQLSHHYKLFCYEFFLTQLDFIKPWLVLCLGKDVYSTFHEEWVDKELFSKCKFEFIPHPSFAHINWKGQIKEKIVSTINDHQHKPRHGGMKGMVVMKEGFNDPLEDFKEYM